MTNTLKFHVRLGTLKEEIPYVIGKTAKEEWLCQVQLDVTVEVSLYLSYCSFF
jgi:hypothetical protein